MDLLKKLFPFSFSEKKDIAALIITIIIYVVVGAIFAALIGLLANINILNFIMGIVGSLAEIYVTAGIVLSILHYIKVLK